MVSALKVKQANIQYHARIADKYETTQPHFGLDNISRLEKTISRLGRKTRGKGVVLDVGCGTGFLMKIAKRHFTQVYGVDITKRMVERIPKSPNTMPVLADSERLPFKKNSFDACISYSFLHHLHHPNRSLREICRVLKPGGVYFNDQDFNRDYFELTESMAGHSQKRLEVKTRSKEVKDIYRAYSMPPVTTRLAEFQEIKKGGFTPKELEAMVKRAGFRTVTVRPRWFIGEARIRREQGADVGDRIDAYLLWLYPVASGLFKYLSFEAVK